MAQNTGTLIGAAIRPNDTNDKIASAFAVEVKGGHHTYALLSSRNSIISERREWGMLCTVYNDGANNGTYQLKYNNNSTTITDNLNWVKFSGSATTGGGGGGSAYWIDPVTSIESIEPGSPSDGVRYILGDSLSGSNWGSLVEGLVVEYNSTLSKWEETTPLDGMSARVSDENNSIYRYEGTHPTGSWIKEKLNQIISISATSSNGTAYNATSDKVFAYDTETLYMVQFATANTGAPTLNINGLGAKSLRLQTNGGLVALTKSDLSTSLVYSVVYDGTYMRLSKPSSDATLVRYRILPGEKVTVPAYQEYLLYGNLEVNGILDVDTNGKVVIINGALNVNGGTVSNSSNVSLITLGSGSGSGTGVNKFSTSISMTGGTTYSVAHNLGTSDYTINTWDETTNDLVFLTVNQTAGSETTTVDLYSNTTLASVRVVVIG